MQSTVNKECVLLENNSEKHADDVICWYLIDRCGRKKILNHKKNIFIGREDADLQLKVGPMY